MSLRHLCLILLSLDYVSGNGCIFGVEDGSVSGECKVSNGAAVGIIVTIVVVVLVVVLVVTWVYCWKAIKGGAGEAAADGINLCSHNCLCCHRHVPEQTFTMGGMNVSPPSYDQSIYPQKY